MRYGLLGGVFLAAVLAAPPAARAQYAEYVWAPEVYYGVGVGADFIGNNSDLDACAQDSTTLVDHCQTITELAGGGAAVFVGVRPSSYFGVELSYDVFFHQGSGQDPYNLATLEALRGDFKVFFLPDSMVDPYLQAGAGLYLFGDEYGVAKAGGGFQLGAGLDLYLADFLSIGASALYRGIYFGSFDVSQHDLPWAAGDGAVKSGFIHDVAVLVNMTIHSIY